MDTWLESGCVAPWAPRLAVVDEHGISAKADSPERFVGVPGMSAVCSSLAAQLRDCRYRWQARQITPAGAAWHVHSAAGDRLTASRVLVTCPPAQISSLIPELVTDRLKALLSGVDMRPCWAVLAAFDRSLLAQFDAAFVNTGPLSWMSSQRDRPGRPQQDAWVLHATPYWSEAHLEASPEWVIAELLRAARELPGSAREAVQRSATAHRWRYAIARAPLEDRVLPLHGDRLLAAGDWAFGSRVEGAWRSGHAAAKQWLAEPADASH